MAVARKCDICGVLYEFYVDDNDDTFNTISLTDTSEYGNVLYSKDLDVCPSCMEAINELFKRRREASEFAKRTVDWKKGENDD